MKAVVYRGPCRVPVEEVAGPKVESPPDAFLQAWSAQHL